MTVPPRTHAYLEAYALWDDLQGPDHAQAAARLLPLQRRAEQAGWGEVTFVASAARAAYAIVRPDGGPPDLASLHRLAELAATEELVVLPGHGPELASAAAVVGHYLRHREERLDQVRRAVAAGASTVDDVVATVYADVDRVLWPAAALSVRAQLADLDESRT